MNTDSNSYKGLRLKNYDYHNGWFFVTNKTNFSKNYLVGDIHNLVRSTLVNLAMSLDGIKIDFMMIMPNHIHVILMFRNSKLDLSEFWRRFKALSTIAVKKTGSIDSSLWQRNYYEHVIRNEAALSRIRKYIQANPYKENLPLREVYEGIARN